MKKFIMLTLLILSVLSGYAESGTFNISQYNNTNDLIRDKQFQKHIKLFSVVLQTIISGKVGWHNR